MPDSNSTSRPSETATFGAGCFWCVEAVFQNLPGVLSVTSGYMGGQTKNPTYRDICSGTTGHAEVVRVEFDPDAITFTKLLEWFWRLHDPTTLNRQGADTGTQYRSAIFYHSAEQQEVAQSLKGHAQSKFAQPIVTEICAATTFYPAEDYHQDYYANNGSAPYCRAVIEPKLSRLGISTPDA